MSGYRTTGPHDPPAGWITNHDGATFPSASHRSLPRRTGAPRADGTYGPSGSVAARPQSMSIHQRLLTERITGRHASSMQLTQRHTAYQIVGSKFRFGVRAADGQQQSTAVGANTTIGESWEIVGRRGRRRLRSPAAFHRSFGTVRCICRQRLVGSDTEEDGGSTSSRAHHSRLD
jgi:hypothetical protein